MDYKKAVYYFLLFVLILGQFVCFILTQYILYDTYFNQIHWNQAYQLLLLPMVFYSALSFIFTLFLDLILNFKEIVTKLSLIGLIFPILMIHNPDNVRQVVIVSVISFISIFYWYFFTFYWKKRNLKDK
jgi:hypothetical protein